MGYLIFLVALIIGMIVFAKYSFNMTIKHETIEVNITCQQVADVVNKVFGS